MGDCHEPNGSRNGDELNKKILKIMKKNILSYSAPEVEVYVVAAERGYGDSVLLPGFGTEDDELTY